MTVNRTTLLDLPLPVTGTESGTWGDTTNNGLTQYLDIAIAGTLVLSTDADVTLTSTEGDSSATNIGATTAQYAILRWTATGSTTRNITALAQSKTYVVINATGGTQSIVLRGAGPTTGVTIISGEKALCVWNGSDFVKVSSSAAAGGSNTQVQYNSSGVLAGSSNLTFDGTSLTLGGNPTLSAGTANGVLYLNGSKVATSGSALTFDGSKLNNSSGSSAGIIQSTDTSGSGNFVRILADASFGSLINFSTGSSLRFATSADNFGSFSEQMRLTSTGLKSSIAGTNADPAFSYTSDTNTGIFFPAADKLGFTAGGGTDQMVLTTTGLGIGTSSPGVKLTVSYTAAAGNIAHFAGANNVNGYIGAHALSNGGLYINSNQANQDLRLQTQGTDRVILDSSGNLGLGVTPSAWVEGTGLNVGSGRGGSIFTETVNYGFTTFNANAYYSATDTWKYVTSNAASRYQQLNGVHSWHTAGSGTAGNAITFTQAMTLDASGNLEIGGTFAQGRKLNVDSSTDGYTVTLLQTGAFNSGKLSGTVYAGYYDGSSITDMASIRGGKENTTSGNYAGMLAFYTRPNGGSDTERARIDSSGNLLVGVTNFTDAGGGVAVASGAASENVRSSATSTGAWGHYGLYNSNGRVGLISTNGTATTYATSSDYRLKDNPQPLTNSGAFIDALQPKTWEWKTDGSRGVGFIAHEVQAVSPASVVGEKDAVDADGKPIMQAMEYGSAEFIANVIAELQSLRQRVALLEGN